MNIDLSFHGVIQEYFERLKIDLCVVNVSTYYESFMRKDPTKLIKKGVRQIDILLTLPAGLERTGTINIMEPAVLFFDAHIIKAMVPKIYDPKQCHLVEKAAMWAVMYLWRTITPEGKIFYTYKGVDEIGSNSVIKLVGIGNINPTTTEEEPKNEDKISVEITKGEENEKIRAGDNGKDI